jgi:hypothetical protein
MSEDFDRKIKLQAMRNLREKRKEDKVLNRVQPDLSQNLAKGDLDKEVLTVKGGTDKISTLGEKQPLISGDEFAAKQREIEKQRMIRQYKKAIEMGDTKGMESLKRKAMQFAGKAAKGLPVVGAIAAGLGSEDASAAVPVLGDAESAGMSPQDENMMMAEIQAQKDYGQSQAAQDKMEALKKLRGLK